MQNIQKRFGSVIALAGVNFDVDAGEVMALVGDNGAGKSTLTKIISGAYQADGGTIFFEGRRFISDPRMQPTVWEYRPSTRI
jgi:ABC-type sugar transport system ATPase subunit